MDSKYLTPTTQQPGTTAHLQSVQISAEILTLYPSPLSMLQCQPIHAHTQAARMAGSCRATLSGQAVQLAFVH